MSEMSLHKSTLLAALKINTEVKSDYVISSSPILTTSLSAHGRNQIVQETM